VRTVRRRPINFINQNNNIDSVFHEQICCLLLS